MSAPEDLVPPARELPPGRLAQRRDHLVRELRRRPPRRRRLTGALLTLGLVPVGVGVAWAAGVFDAPVSDITVVECRPATGGVALELPTDIAGRLPRSAAEVCTALPQAVTALGYRTADGTLRPLVTCRGERRAVVIPDHGGADECERAGLEPLGDQAFRAEAERQVRAVRAVSGLVPAARDNGSFAAGEGAPCIPAGRVVGAARKRLAAAGLGDFQVGIAPGSGPQDCATGLEIDVARDGRALLVRTERTDLPPASPACARILAERRVPGTGSLQLLEAVACLDERLSAERGIGLQPAEAARLVHDRLGLTRWRVRTRVPAGRGRLEFSTTSADRRRQRLVLGFRLRPVIPPGDRGG